MQNCIRFKKNILKYLNFWEVDSRVFLSTGVATPVTPRRRRRPCVAIHRRPGISERMMRPHKHFSWCVLTMSPET